MPTGQLVARDKQLFDLQQHITFAFEQCQSTSIYLSGAPGTGKTATVLHCLQSLSTTHNYHSVYINCVSMRTLADLYRTILEKCSKPVPTTRQMSSAVYKIFRNQDKPTLLVLDEIDHLSSRSQSQSILYTAFKWPALSSARLVLIGIANSLDLTERLLPKLKLISSPKLIQFPPYSKDDVIEILEHRLGKDTVLDRTAIELCARKVSAMTGDIRKALDLCRDVADRMRQDATTDGQRPPKLACRHVLETVQIIYGNAIVRAKLPLQSRLLLATTLALHRRSIKTPTLNQLYTAYKRACLSNGYDVIDQGDVVTGCAMLESHGLISTVRHKQQQQSATPFSRKIQLLVDEESASAIINDNALLASVFDAVI